MTAPRWQPREGLTKFAACSSIRPRGLVLLVTMLVVAGAARTPEDLRVSAPVAPALAQDIVLVEAKGTTTLNVSPDNPFWSVTHVSGPSSIVSITFDFGGSLSAAHANACFDVDQLGMAGCFVRGRPAHGGTYRRGSDLACGLLYDGGNTFTGALAGPTAGGIAGAPVANCGFQASAPVPGRTSFREYRRLKFRFQPGAFHAKSFEFDVDVDGCRGNGTSMAGLAVTVELAGGLGLSGFLATDTASPTRSFVVLQ